MNHYALKGWLKTGCGLSNDERRKTTNEESAVDCKNCASFMDSAMPIHAWQQCKPSSLRRLYLERAGIEPRRVEKILRVPFWSALTATEKRAVIRQMQSNPKLARLLALPHKPIESGSSLDQRNKYPRFNHLLTIKQRFCCTNCGWPV